MEKRVVFRSAWLPYALVAPQIAITIVFFFWPAVQAVWYSFQLQDAFGLKTPVRRPAELRRPVQGRATTSSRSRSPRCSACWWRSSASPISLLLAIMADRVLRGAMAYKTLLIWPYAVAPAVAGVLWAFLFAPSIGIVTLRAQGLGHRLELAAQRRPGDAAGRGRLGVEADLLQLPVLPRRPAVDPALADRGGGDRRRRRRSGASGRSSSRCCRRPRSSCWWSTSSTRSSTPSASSTPPPRAARRRRPRSSSTRSTTTASRRRDLGSSAAQSVILMFIVIALTVVQFRFIERKVQY